MSYSMDIKKLSSYLFFFIAFPINFFYNFGLVKGWFPKIPGLGYPTLTHLCLPFIYFYSLYYLYSFFQKKYYTCFIIYCFLAITATLIGHVFVSSKYGLAPLYQSLWSIVYLYAFSFLSLFLFEKNIFGKKIILYMLIIMTCIAVMNLKTGSTIPFSLDNIAGTHLNHINYQIVSFIFLITWFFYYFSNEKIFFKIVACTCVLFLLLVSGGRSELFGFIFAFTYIFIINLNFFKIRISNILLLFSLMIGIILFTLIFIDFDNLFLPLQRSRHLEIANLSSSSSWLARESIFDKNISYILESPILGNFGSHFQIEKGAYIHNFLSAWQQYGLIIFILYIILVLTPFVHLTYKKLSSSESHISLDASLFLASYSLLVVLITKSVFWDYLGLSIGAYLYQCFLTQKTPDNTYA